MKTTCTLASLCLLFTCISFAITTDDLSLEEEWFVWKAEYNRSYYDIGEELERYAIWQSNKRYIEEHNRYVDVFGFALKMNNFGDLTSAEYFESTAGDEEFMESSNHNKHFRKYGERNKKKHKHKHHHHHHHHHGNFSNIVWEINEEGYFHLPKSFNESHLPKTVDWRTSGAVTPVKDQGYCQSSYAFSILGAIEGSYALATGKLEPLSEQNVIDCSILYGNKGCKGGSREAAIYYIIDNNGVDTAKTYPYTGSQGMCRFNTKTIGASISGFVRIKKGKERDLQAAVAMVGPVTIALDHRHAAFRFYSYGIFDARICSTRKLSHAMLAVGYGKEGKDHWILKNSWGPTWGIDGYMKLARNGNNQCGVASRALFPKQ